MLPAPTDTVTFLFTDIENSTRLWERHPQAMRVSLARHDALLTQAFQSHDGHIFKTAGDEFCVVFASGPAALHAALDAQRALCAEAWNEAGPLRVRMAIHTGDAELRDGDYYGGTLSRVARLRSAAHGGQTLLSQAVRELAADALPADTGLRDLGLHRLKDLQRAERIFQLLHPDLPDEFPTLRSLEAFVHNLPLQITSFVGREQEMEAVKRLLQKTSLLTLTGAGGLGKTRLALQVAADVLHEYPDGVWLVELAALADPALVVPQVARALGVREEPERPLPATLADHLRDKNMLLLLDNCEPVVEACARLSESLLRGCANLTIMTTSRESLGILGERLYAVPSLTSPDTEHLPPVGQLVRFEAVGLFLERARVVAPGFAVTETNAAALAQICHRLDGIPFGIELAAPLARVLPVEQIAARLQDRFRLLKSGSRTAPARQLSLRAMVDSSYDLLGDQERLLLRRLSVFSGGWTLGAAEAVCSGDGVTEWDILDLLARLVSKSLVLVEDRPGETAARYRLFETIREYAHERLEEAGETERWRERHRDWFLALAERAEPELVGAEKTLWLDRLDADHDNLRAALLWSVDGDLRLRLAVALWRFWYERGYTVEGRTWLEGALVRTPNTAPSLRAKALSGAGVLACSHGEYAFALSFHEQGLQIARDTADRKAVARSLNNLGIVARHQRDYSRAFACYEESREIYRDMGDSARVAMSLNNLGCVAHESGDYQAAVPYFEESLRLYRALGHTSSVAINLHNLGAVMCRLGELTQAAAYFREGLELKHKAHSGNGVVSSFIGLAEVARARGDWEEAVALCAAADSARSAFDICLRPDDLRHYEENVASLRDKLPADRFRSAWERGASLTREQAVAYALGQLLD